MVTIDEARPDDAEVISQIIGEIEAYYGGAHVPGDIAQIRAALFSDRPVATVLLARDGADVLGLASYTLMWPAAGAETSLFLKELFVREPARRNGIARALLASLHDAAADKGCSRIEWLADRDNPPALAFYAAVGAKADDGKVFFRIQQ